MNMDMVIKLRLVGVLLGFLFQAVASNCNGTSSVMSLARDALVFVKVCVHVYIYNLSQHRQAHCG